VVVTNQEISENFPISWKMKAVREIDHTENVKGNHGIRSQSFFKIGNSENRSVRDVVKSEKASGKIGKRWGT